MASNDPVVHTDMGYIPLSKVKLLASRGQGWAKDYLSQHQPTADHPQMANTSALQDLPLKILSGGRAQSVSSPVGSVGSVDPDQLRQFLISKGYDLPKTGGLDSLLKSALGDFLDPNNVGSTMSHALGKTNISGKRDPHVWNSQFGGPTTKAKPVLPNKEILDPNGNTTSPYLGLDNGDNGSVSSSFLDNLLGKPATRLSPALANEGARIIPSSLAKGGAQLLDPALAKGGATPLSADWASKLASMSFDAPIQAARDNATRVNDQGEQNLHDIGHWYDQVFNAQAKAAGQDHTISEAGKASEAQSNAAILASLGGGANGAASAVASTGQNNLGTLGALGVNQDQYNADVQPLLKAEGAAASTREAAQQSQRSADAARQIEDLMAQKGSAQAGTAFQVAQYNNGLRDTQQGHLLDILGQNNTVRDNRSSRLLNIVGANNQTRDARVDRSLGVTQYNNQLNQQGIDNRLKRDSLALSALGLGAKYQAAADKPTKGAFTNATSQQKLSMADSILAGLFDPNSNKPMFSASEARQKVFASAVASGWNPQDAAVKTWINAILAQYGPGK